MRNLTGDQNFPGSTNQRVQIPEPCQNVSSYTILVLTRPQTQIPLKNSPSTPSATQKGENSGMLDLRWKLVRFLA